MTGLDDDGDTLTYRLENDAGGTQSIDPATGVITATFNASTPSVVRFVADSDACMLPRLILILIAFLF